ncbi:MAG: ribonuclease R [Bacteroidetes bacterium]|nr:ribonuclease R [Bacteroidota bacterium]
MSNKKSGPKKAKNRIRKDLLTFLKTQPNTPFNFKQLRKQLKLTSASHVMHLENAVGQLVHEKVLEMVGTARVQYTSNEAPQASRAVVEDKNHVVGVLDTTRNGSGFIINDRFDQDVFVPSKYMRNALDGDKVKVRVIKAIEGKRPEGEIVEIVERGRTQFVCTMQMSEKFAFGVPDNRKIDVDFFIPLSKVGNAKQGDKALVRLIGYSETDKNPVGEVLGVLGRPGEHETEMSSIILEHNLPLQFPEKVETAAENIPEDISEREISKRRDFRNILTFTIDPWDAKDFDDAISFNQLEEEGLYEVGVHIADVSHYVRPDSVIDKEAQHRATSVYLVDRVIPMLPERLSNGLCSLRPNETKLCYSAVFHINTNGTVKDRWFGRTVIHSDRRFTYEEAQERIETKEGDLQEEINVLNGIAKKLRDKRYKNGAISFEREEMRFKLDDAGKPIDIVMKVSKDAHKLIEEFMLLANREVATHFKQKVTSKKNPPFVYRVHDQPDEAKLTGLQMMAARFGHNVDLHNVKDASKEINKLLAGAKDKPEYNMLSILAIRSMAKAKYTTQNAGHYGLAFENYTHFTSPIRRYPDVMVHRLMAQYLDGNDKVDAERLEEHCKHSSAQEIGAESAERDSTKYKQVEYMQQFVGDEFDGHISGLTDSTMFVELTNRCEGGLRLSEMIDDSYYFDELNYQVIGHNKRRTYKLGDPVKVRVVGCDLEKRIIELDLIGKNM